MKLTFLFIGIFFHLIQRVKEIERKRERERERERRADTDS